MACETFKREIYNVLKEGYFGDKNDFVDVSDGYDDLVHVVVVSRKFNGDSTIIKRGDIIGQELLKHFPDGEWGDVSLTVGRLPEEVRLWWKEPAAPGRYAPAKGVRERIDAAFNAGCFGDADVFVDAAYAKDGKLHIVVISREFASDDSDVEARYARVWEVLSKGLTSAELARVVRLVCVNPETIKRL